MAKIKLTDDKVAKLQPDTTGGKRGKGVNVCYWDSQMAGFGVQLTPAGARVFVLKYNADGRSRWVTIGPFPAYGVKSAKARAGEIRQDLDKGKDPKAARKAMMTAPKVEALAKRYVDEHVMLKTAVSSQTNSKHLLNDYILPRLGKKAIREITTEDVAQLHHAMRETPYLANRMLAVVSKMFRLGKTWKFEIQGNPVEGIQKFDEKPRDRPIREDELVAICAELQKREDDEPYIVAAIRLLLLTGARMNEILQLEWDRVTLDYAEEVVDGERRMVPSGGSLLIINHKTAKRHGSKVIHLSPEAAAELDLLKRQYMGLGNPHVLPGSRIGGHLTNLEKPWQAIREAVTKDEKNEGINVRDVRIHDFRHWYGSTLGNAGVAAMQIMAALGHTQVSTTRRYVHVDKNPLKEAAGKVGAAFPARLAK